MQRSPVATSTSTSTGSAFLINSLSTKKNSYFWVRNVGTFATTGFIISQVVSPTGRSPSVEIRSCSGVWDVVKDTCTGVVTTLLTTSDGASSAATVPIPLLVGEAVQLAAYPTKNGMTTAVSASVDRTAIRAPVTTHG